VLAVVGMRFMKHKIEIEKAIAPENEGEPE
jgi:hypothetical protein